MEIAVLCLFPPEPGKVLTGLQSLLKPEQCAKLYEAFLEDAFEFTQELGVKRLFACSPNANHPYFQALSKRFYVEMIDYAGTQPGQRIQNALNLAFQKGGSKVVLWDCESPALSPRQFRDVFVRLQSSDVVLGPAMDYGTYLIGATKKSAEIFATAKWNTPSEFADLVNAAEAAKLTVFQHQPWPRLRRPEDLPYFLMNLKQATRSTPKLSRHTQTALQAFGLLPK